MIYYLIRRSWLDTGIFTLQISVMSRRCFLFYRLVWDPSDFTFYEFLVFRDFADDMLGDFPDDDWLIAIDRGRWSIRNFPFETWRHSVVDVLSVDDHVEFSMMFDFRVGI